MCPSTQTWFYFLFFSISWCQQFLLIRHLGMNQGTRQSLVHITTRLPSIQFWKKIIKIPRNNIAPLFSYGGMHEYKYIREVLFALLFVIIIMIQQRTAEQEIRKCSQHPRNAELNAMKGKEVSTKWSMENRYPKKWVWAK